MAAKRHERTRARRDAIQVLYTAEIRELSPIDIAQSESGRLAEDGPLSGYAFELVQGVCEHQSEVDEHLAATSENWSLARMPVVDRSILRLATYEMIFVDDVPISVSINEAVELAKDFGGEDDSPRFVNGVLGRIAKRLSGEGESEGELDSEIEDATATASATADAQAEDASVAVEHAGSANIADEHAGDVSVADGGEEERA